ncbi:MAG: glycosyltransferase [Anaerocolumna sp.]
MKKKLLFVITQFYKGGAEVALLNLFNALSSDEYEIDFLVFDQMILKNATSLLPKVPDWIKVCNAAEKEGKAAIIVKIISKTIRKITKKQIYRLRAYNFIKRKEYDIAFSYGEWLSPEFIAKKVNAKKKYVWIHTDIDKAPYVDKDILFGYDSYYTGYIFVSENSKRSAEAKFKEVVGKSHIVHNMCDDEMIKKFAEIEVPVAINFTKPLLLTVGNLRDEKNHKRQIEVMYKLKKLGIDLQWINVGSTANVFLYQQLKNLVNKYNIHNDFIFVGVDDNPYKYMRQADMVAVLSDFESWSLVITEAKILGKPVIATKTSGALEQIIDGETGILVDFEIDNIASTLQQCLSKPEKLSYISNNLVNFSTFNDVIREFNLIVKG